MRVYIIVLNWNQARLTIDCVRSLRAVDYPDYRVVVVDNGSQDGSVQKLRAEFGDWIHIIGNETNLGFAGGNNVGIAYALERGADYVMLLNNDTEVPPGFLSPLVELLQCNRQVAAVTPKIYFMHDRRRICAAGGEIPWWLGKGRSRGHNQLDCGQFDQGGSVAYGSGCCLLITRTALENVGLLDESLFVYAEDADWCMRARQAGYLIWYEPSSRIWHVGSASTAQKKGSPTKGRSPFVYYFTTRNNYWFILRYGKGLGRVVALTTFCICHVLFYSLGFLALRRWSKLRNLWRGAWDGWRLPDRSL